jgi:hypothetical protein
MSLLPDTPTPIPNPILQILVPLLDSHLAGMISFLWRLGLRVFNEQTHPSDYEILDYDACLELLDTKGNEAVFTKTERVQFLQNNIIAYKDMAWGAGEVLAKYECSPGVAVDTYREGHRLRILISLRTTKNRGDVTEFHIRRTILGAFTKQDESFQHDVIHLIYHASLRIIFPKKRYPKSIAIIEQNSTRTIPLGPKQQTILPDGRLEVVYQIRKPRLFESYIMNWSW